MATSRINYTETMQQAEDLLQLSQKLNQEIATLEELLNTVKREWKGPASNAYQNQLLMLIADMKSVKFNMSSLSTTIKNVANRICSDEQA